jgi:hypothetical protein
MSRLDMRVAAFAVLLRCSQRQFRESLGFGGGASSGASSSITGSVTTYLSLAQLPRSVVRQRSLQKGKSASVSESVGLPQMGHVRFIVASAMSVPL